MLFRSGGIVVVPPGLHQIYATIAIGDGAINRNYASKSTRNWVLLQGSGAGDEELEVAHGTEIRWVGAASSAPLLAFYGLIKGCEVSNFFLNGNNLCGNILHLQKTNRSEFKNLLLRDCQAGYIGIFLQGSGCGLNCFYNVDVYNQTAGSMCLGLDPYLLPADTAGISQNSFHRCGFVYGNFANSYGIYLRGGDNNIFIECSCWSAGASGNSLYLDNSGLNFAGLPNENAFENCAFMGGPLKLGGTPGPNWFNSFPTSDGENPPIGTAAQYLSLLAHPDLYGVYDTNLDGYMRWFGSYKYSRSETGVTYARFSARTGSIDFLGLVKSGEGAALASAATITITNNIHRVTGTTTIGTIQVPAGFSGLVTFYKTDAGSVTFGVGGNIPGTFTLAQNGHLTLVYNGSAWY